MSQYDAVVKGRRKIRNQRWLCMEFSTDNLTFNFFKSYWGNIYVFFKRSF